MTVTRQYWRLDNRPDGHAYPKALSLQTETMSPLAENEVLIEADYLSMDPGVRVWMTDREDGYSPPIPLGSPMQGQFIGRVLETRNVDFAKGDLVRGFGHWATHSKVKPAIAGLTKLEAETSDIRDHFGVLGLNGATAMCGLVDVLELQEGESVLASAAAGATGSVVCQIAKSMNCHVTGIAGSVEKCAWLQDKLGIDVAINYKAQNVAAELQKNSDGFNVYFENVGGDLLEAALPNMALNGRVGICGLIAGYTSSSGKPGPANFDQILMKRLTVKGIFLPDFLAQGRDYYPSLKQLYDSGRLSGQFDETFGIENVLDAFTTLMTGQNMGKVIVALNRN